MPEVTHLQIASIWVDVSLREQHNSSAQVTRYPIEDGADVTDHVRLMPDQIVIEGVVTNQPIEPPRSHADGATADESGFQLRRQGGDGPLDRMRAAGTTSVTVEGEPSVGFLGLLPGVDQGATLLRTVGLDVRGKRKFEMLLPKMVLGSSQLHAAGMTFSKPFDRVKAVHDALRTAFIARRPVQIVTGLRVYEAVVLVDLSVMRDAASAGILRFGATGEIIRLVKSATSLAGAPDPLHSRAQPAVNTGNQTTAAVAPTEIAARDRMSALALTVSGGLNALANALHP